MADLALVSAPIADRARRFAPHIALAGGVWLSTTQLPWSALIQLAGLLVAVGVVACGVRRPDLVAASLIVLLPVQVLALAWLYALGVPAPAVSGLSALKELLTASLFLAGILGFARAPSRRLDTLDRLALAIVGLVAVYLVLGPIITPNTPGGLGAHLVGLRANAGYVLAFLGARHARWPPGSDRTLLRAAFAAVVVGAASVTWHGLRPGSFVDFTTGTVDLLRYQADIVGNDEGLIRQLVARFRDERRFGVFLAPLAAGNVLLVGFALAVPMAVARRRPLVGLLVAALCITGILFTGTRIALVGCAVVLLVALRPSVGATGSRRLNIAVLALLALALLAPELTSTRFAGNTEAQLANTGHVREITTGITRIVENPVGVGLGAGGGTARRFADGGTELIAGRSVLAMGVQMGVAAMVIYVSFWLLLLRRSLSAASNAEPASPIASGSLALLGLLLASLTNEAMTSLAATTIVFVLVGRGLQDASDD